MTFEHYADYYDLLYHDKHYEAECDFLEQIFARYAQHPIRTILDLGCGTGGHALPLAKRGYLVTGVDLSEHMLERARQKAAEAGLNIRFHQGDIRTIKLDRTFDAVIAMFAVISYQTGNEDLGAAFRTARRHLEPGGLFVFDCWFGPAVLVQRPTDRYKIVEINGERIIRFAHPTLDIMRHTVQVDYKVLRLKDDRVLDEVGESHVMRFLFPQEIQYYLQANGFKLLRFCPFMRLKETITECDWNASVVVEAV
jgi:SAM-dependent methyltransferase